MSTIPLAARSRQAVDDDVEEGADEQAGEPRGGGEREQHAAGRYFTVRPGSPRHVDQLIVRDPFQ